MRGKFIFSIVYSFDGKYLVSGVIDGIINIFDIVIGKFLYMLEGYVMFICFLIFFLDFQFFVIVLDDGYIKIYDV